MTEEDDDGVRTLPLRRHCGDAAEAIGVAPTQIIVSSSGSRRKADGSTETKCLKCGVYFSEEEPHTIDMCELAQIMDG